MLYTPQQSGVEELQKQMIVKMAQLYEQGANACLTNTCNLEAKPHKLYDCT